MPSRLRTAALGALALLSPLTPAAAQDAAPRYSLRYLGEGGPSGMNADGVVIGARLDAAQRYQPLVAAPGEGWAPLPLPEGAVQAFRPT